MPAITLSISLVRNSETRVNDGRITARGVGFRVSSSSSSDKAEDGLTSEGPSPLGLYTFICLRGRSLVETEDSDDESEEMSMTSDLGFKFAIVERIFGVFGTSVYLIWVKCELKASL
jgi:hypothetical protein